MNTWPRKPISSVVDAVIDYRGRTPPRSVSGIPTISAKHVKRGRVEHCGERFVSQQTYDQWTTRGLIKPGDVLITTEAPVGEVALVPSDQTYLITRRVIAMQFDPARACERFVMYSLLADPHRKALGNLGHGATVPRVFKKDILDFEIPMPGVGTQRRVGSVLGAFDDLMENNRRRIEILEEMARLLYREWFVHFRFPGHEDVELVDSDLGAIPKGWDQTCLADEIKLERVNVKPFEHPDEEFDHYSIPAFDDRRLPSPELGADIRSGKYLLSGECLMVSKLNPRLPRVWRVDRSDLGQRAVASTEFLVLTRPIGWTLAFVYGLVTSSDFASSLATTAGGTSTSHQRVRPADVMKMAVVKPPSEFVLGHSDQVQPMLKLADKLIHQNEVLRAARDLLLPRLVSGELDVSELDLGLERVGA